MGSMSCMIDCCIGIVVMCFHCALDSVSRAGPGPRPMRPGPRALSHWSKFGALQNILVLGLNRSFFRAERPKVYSNPSTESWFGPLLFENK